MDNIFVAYEAVYSLRLKNKGKYGFIFLKLDISKAYDQVE